MNENQKAAICLRIRNFLAAHAREPVAFPLSASAGFVASETDAKTIDDEVLGEAKKCLSELVRRGLVREVPLFGHAATDAKRYAPSTTSDPWAWVEVS